MEPKRHSSQFFEGRIKETVNLAKDITQLEQNIQQQLATLDQTIGTHLWLLPDFASLASSSLSNALKQSKTLLSRVQAVMNAYQQLPRL